MNYLKRFLLVFTAVFFAAEINAQSLQKIFCVDSNEYAVIKDIYLLQGKSLPSGTGPWSAAELLEMTYKINSDEIPEALAEEYNSVLENIKRNGERGSEKINFNFDGEINFENYIHTNTNGSELHDINWSEEDSYNKIKLFSGRKNWSYDLTKISPFFKFNWETWVQKTFYAWFEIPLMNTFDSLMQIGDTNFNCNIPLFQNYLFDYSTLDMNFPYRAFVSFGGDAWSVQLGRDRLNWGHGKTGNLTMSDNLPYHNMLRFTAFSERYKYTFLTSVFPHEENYFKGGRYSLTGSPNDEMFGTEYYIAHRIEGRFFNDRLTGTITEGVMYSSKDSRIQFETLNPVSFYHNNYTTANNNSILEFELDWTVIKGLNIYGQFVIDEFQFGFEDQAWPNGNGFLGGVNYAVPLFGGIFTANAEGACIDPYTYLRYKTSPGGAAYEPYGIDFIVANRVFSISIFNRAVYEEYCLGYKYGPDCITANLNCGWKKQKLELGFNYFFMGHGTHDFWSKWAEKKSFDEDYIDDNFTTPTTSHESTNNRFTDDDERDSVWYTNTISLSASYRILPGLKVFGQADYVIVKNAFNDSSNGIETDLQLVLGIKWNCF